MSKSQQTPARTVREWNAPRLVRIGTIADVTGNTGSAFQQGNNKS